MFVAFIRGMVAQTSECPCWDCSTVGSHIRHWSTTLIFTRGDGETIIFKYVSSLERDDLLQLTYIILLGTLHLSHLGVFM